MKLRRRSRYGYRSRLRASPWQVTAALVLAVTAVAAAGLAGAALWLDPERAASRTIALAEPPDVVWQLLADLDNLPTWRRGISRIERLPDVAGRPAWLEFNGVASRAVRVAEAKPPVRLVTEQRDTQGRPGTWVWDLTRHPAGSQLTVTRRVVLSGPLERALGGLFGWPGREVDQAVADLAGRLAAASRLRTTALNR